MSTFRKFTLYSFLILFTLFLLELTSFIGIVFFLKPSHPEYFRQDFDQWVDNLDKTLASKYLAESYDPELGWVSKPNSQSKHEGWEYSIDSKGRRTNNSPGPDLIATFGDSHTFCSEVNDNETWQQALSELTDTKVLNFGEGGYGTDQVLLKLTRELKRGLRPKMVIFGMHTQEMCHLTNIYRAFFHADAKGIKLKPYLKEASTSFIWEFPTLPAAPTPEDLACAIRSKQNEDFYYLANKQRPKDGFPYSKAVIDYINFFIDVDIHGKKSLLKYGGGVKHCWNCPVALRRMDEIMNRFAALSEEYHFTPVILIVPSAAANISNQNHHRFFEEQKIKHQHAGLIVVGLDTLLLPENYIGHGHPSPSGYRFIADKLHQALWQHSRYREMLAERKVIKPSLKMEKVFTKVFELNSETYPKLTISHPLDAQWLNDYIEINAQGRTFINLPQSKQPIAHIELELESNVETLLELYSGQNENTGSVPNCSAIYPGKNKLLISPFINTAHFVRIDIGLKKGLYKILSLKVFAEDENKI